MAAGRVYDVDENKRMTDFLNETSADLSNIDKEKLPSIAMRYGIILIGSCLLLLGLKYLIKQKK